MYTIFSYWSWPQVQNWNHTSSGAHIFLGRRKQALSQNSSWNWSKDGCRITHRKSAVATDWCIDMLLLNVRIMLLPTATPMLRTKISYVSFYSPSCIKCHQTAQRSMPIHKPCRLCRMPKNKKWCICTYCSFWYLWNKRGEQESEHSYLAAWWSTLLGTERLLVPAKTVKLLSLIASETKKKLKSLGSVWTKQIVELNMI
jgi:hypothetical protein